jgi:hypothetical protein|tara:strand:- start:584 stop:796 length:213 start_codon:yes stop_codon:yes gene_type:complete
MGSYLLHLKRAKFSSSERWIIKYNDDHSIREVKQIFNPTEYRKNGRARELHNQEQLINILQKYHDKTRNA